MHIQAFLSGFSWTLGHFYDFVRASRCRQVLPVFDGPLLSTFHGRSAIFMTSSGPRGVDRFFPSSTGPSYLHFIKYFMPSLRPSTVSLYIANVFFTAVSASRQGADPLAIFGLSHIIRLKCFLSRSSQSIPE